MEILGSVPHRGGGEERERERGGGMIEMGDSLYLGLVRWQVKGSSAKP